MTHKEPISHIEDALSNKKFCDVEFTFNPSAGKLFLVGHVLTPIDYQEMRFSLDQIPFITSVEDTVIIYDGVTKMMNDLLGSNPDWKSVNVHAPKPGKFIATGYLQTAAELADVTEFFTENFPYFDRIDFKIAVEDTLKVQIDSLFMASGFASVTYALNNGEVIVSGVYNHKREGAFEETIDKIKKLHAIVQVKNFAIPTSEKLAAVDLSSKFTVSGISFHDGKGFSAVLNGKIYTVDEWVDGLQITDIEENTILLEKDGIKYKIDYTQ